MHVYEWTTDSIVDDEQKRSNLVGSVLLKPDVEIFAPGYRSRSQNGERTLGTRQENRPHYEIRFHFLFSFVLLRFSD